jgi:hypothetical protein
MSLDRRVLDVVSPERTFTGMGAHYCVTSAEKIGRENAKRLSKLSALS